MLCEPELEHWNVDVDKLLFLYENLRQLYNLLVVNPRRACAARVTVLGLCVCLSVCLHLFSSYRDQAGSSAIPMALAQQGLEKLCGDFA